MKSLKIDYETLTENEKLLVSLLRHDSTFYLINMSINGHTRLQW